MARYWLCQMQQIAGTSNYRTCPDITARRASACQVWADDASRVGLYVSTADMTCPCGCMTEIGVVDAAQWLDDHGVSVVKRAAYVDQANVSHPAEYKSGYEILKQWYGWESGQVKP